MENDWWHDSLAHGLAQLISSHCSEQSSVEKVQHRLLYVLVQRVRLNQQRRDLDGSLGTEPWQSDFSLAADQAPEQPVWKRQRGVGNVRYVCGVVRHALTKKIQFQVIREGCTEHCAPDYLEASQVDRKLATNFLETFHRYFQITPRSFYGTSTGASKTPTISGIHLRYIATGDVPSLSERRIALDIRGTAATPSVYCYTNSVASAEHSIEQLLADAHVALDGAPKQL